MNRYQKKVSKEIKALVKRDKFGRLTYKNARKIWQWAKRWNWCSPCEDCDNCMCEKPKMAIAYCPERR
jgi:hypothetical protein